MKANEREAPWAQDPIRCGFMCLWTRAKRALGRRTTEVAANGCYAVSALREELASGLSCTCDASDSEGTASAS
jgi:hypothetical protein